VAGKQRGKGDERYLWPEMLRVVRELAPRWVIGENVPGILRIAAADVVADLERQAYNVVVFNFEAAAVGAPHRRERVFFVGERQAVAHSLRDGCGNGTDEIIPAETGVDAQCNTGGRGSHVPDTDTTGLQGRAQAGNAGGRGEETQQQLAGYGSVIVSDTQSRGPRPKSGGSATWGFGSNGLICYATGEGLSDGTNKPLGRYGTQEPESERPDGRAVESRLGGMVDGFPRWLDEPDGVLGVITGMKDRANRLKCLGNAVVPQQAYPIFRAIALEEAKP